MRNSKSAEKSAFKMHQVVESQTFYYDEEMEALDSKQNSQLKNKIESPRKDNEISSIKKNESKSSGKVKIIEPRSPKSSKKN